MESFLFFVLPQRPERAIEAAWLPVHTERRFEQVSSSRRHRQLRAQPLSMEALLFLWLPPHHSQAPAKLWLPPLHPLSHPSILHHVSLQ